MRFKSLAARHSLELAEIVEELDVSGRKPIEERELDRLLRKVEAGYRDGENRNFVPLSVAIGVVR